MIKWKGITVDEKLEKFLKDNNAYEAFCENINNEEGFEGDDYVLHRISEPFIWRCTKQGVDYWSALQDKFDAL